jgi:uncharacterized protein YfkK (UPF0435 family)
MVDQVLENLRFREEQFMEVAKHLGWSPELKVPPWDFMRNRYRELMDLHDLVKKQAQERREQK